VKEHKMGTVPGYVIKQYEEMTNRELAAGSDYM
jgi:hypothetical protein